jgi:hypothetical protein
MPLQSQTIVKVMADQPAEFRIIVTDEPFIITDNSVLFGENLMVEGGKEPYTYSWYRDGNPAGSDPVLEVPLPAGDETYLLIAGDANNCSATISITPGLGVSAGKTGGPAGLPLVYPVPASKFINIDPNGITGSLKIRVFNNLGNAVLNRQITGKSLLEIDLPPGIYFMEIMEINTGKPASVKKIIIL